ncbi:MAG TPA: SpoIID/LytB domain-containing protein [Syntrophorhabdaceae bacterium]|nr:SpoIID/LytB domain-containing protein [Syntrophorhabdaceae bacterium]HQM82928.1 SpoIID/LytB domain-containing protein [Syntrophorhabdaceae bacterium]
MNKEPMITVGIMDRQTNVSGTLNGNFHIDGFGGNLSGSFSARTSDGAIVFKDIGGRDVARSRSVRLMPHNDSTFTLFHVTIGISFHWERTENQTFRGGIVLQSRDDGTMAVINEVPLEDYLQSVVSSEMNATAPLEFLKTHAIISRSWLLSTLKRKKEKQARPSPAANVAGNEHEIMRWYEQEEHDIYDVCADDHCQRYQGITKIFSGNAETAVRETFGKVIMYRDEICDARYYKTCGGMTEDFCTAWGDKHVPYLISITDAPSQYSPVRTEEDAFAWIFSKPEAYCNTGDAGLLAKILPDFDRETKDFFRWKIEYAREELEEILRERSGLDFGTLKEIRPLQRGPSGRIFRLMIIGSKRTVVVGKELEIRRWLSRSHLYSSAFVVTTKNGSGGEVERFSFHGAGWGHGVGLCQIGAAVMASKGFSAEQVLAHYFPGTELRKAYEE